MSALFAINVSLLLVLWLREKGKRRRLIGWLQTEIDRHREFMQEDYSLALQRDPEHTRRILAEKQGALTALNGVHYQVTGDFHRQPTTPRNP